MTDKSGISSQVLSLPSGGASIKGMNEEFATDLHSGTSKFSIPIKIPKGRNGIQPNLSLKYSSKNSNGEFGMGWNISIPKITRKTTKGIPTYDEKFEGDFLSIFHNDIFVLGNSDELINCGKNIFKSRIETNFSKIKIHKKSNSDYFWTIQKKNGDKLTFGEDTSNRIFDKKNPKKIFSWLLNSIEDTHGNKVLYHYKSDNDNDLKKLNSEKNHIYNNVYLDYIEYVEFHDSKIEKNQFLWRVEFDHGEYDSEGNKIKNMDIREDRFSNYRSGFEIRTTRKCNRILLKRKISDSQNLFSLVKSFNFDYVQNPDSKISLIHKVQTYWFKNGNRSSFPPITFSYSDFLPSNNREFFTPNREKGNLPDSELGKHDYEILDLFGNALPSVVVSTLKKWYYWKNMGDTQFQSKQEMLGGTDGNLISHQGVQFADVNGDGSVELLVTYSKDKKGFYRKNSLSGAWKNFVPYSGPDVNIEDPEIKLVDLSGDGVTDILITNDEKIEYWRNLNDFTELKFEKKIISKQDFPPINFRKTLHDSRLIDLTGDGLKDLVKIDVDANFQLTISFWSNLGYGKFSSQSFDMENSPLLPITNYEPKRLFFADITGNGLSDLVYVDYSKVYFWINQNGNSFGNATIIDNTPKTPDPSTIRLADMKGSGTTGILWTYGVDQKSKSNYVYIDFTNGIKPNLLTEIDNHVGRKITLEYKPSTSFYLNDLKNGLEWKTVLPFPFHVVSRVIDFDSVSKGKLISTYQYHHGYWDGQDKEFHGFGRVDVRNTEFFNEYNKTNDHEKIPKKFFSPPLEKRIWFHQGSVGDPYVDWKETNFSNEFSKHDKNNLSRPINSQKFLDDLPRTIKRNALRSLSGKKIREETYVLDGTPNQSKPVSVDQIVYGVFGLPIGKYDPEKLENWQESVFSPYKVSTRKTIFNRGNDPIHKITFYEKYSKYGIPQLIVSSSVPRGRNFTINSEKSEPYLIKATSSVFGENIENNQYIVDKLCMQTSYEILNNGKQKLIDIINNLNLKSHTVISQKINYFDGEAFLGLPFTSIGKHGALSKTETLVLTEDLISKTYRLNNLKSSFPQYSLSKKTLEEYPKDFLISTKQSGYEIHSKKENEQFVNGYFSLSQRFKYDFQEENSSSWGLKKSSLDPLGNETQMIFDDYEILPIQINYNHNLSKKTKYDYDIMQPIEIVDFNDNKTELSYYPNGLQKSLKKIGKKSENTGDVRRDSVEFSYNLTKIPISVHSKSYIYHDSDDEIPDGSHVDDVIEKTIFYDGYGRTFQTRTQAENYLIGDSLFGDLEESTSINIKSLEKNKTRVLVSGWKIYNNLGMVVEKFEPFFSTGFEYDIWPDPNRMKKISKYYDGLGNLICTEYPNGSKEKIVHGVPTNIDNPDIFEPTPWEKYTYDQNDNGKLTHESNSKQFRHHWNTPVSIKFDGLGRVISKIEVMNSNQTHTRHTKFSYDLQGNLLSETDTNGRLVFQHVYDYTSHKISTTSMESGLQISCYDSMGHLIESRDSKGSLKLQILDSLNRPYKIWYKNNFNEKMGLREFFIYGDDEENSGFIYKDAKNGNLLGRIFRHFDEAGLIEFPYDPKFEKNSPYDFKGNILEKCRYVFKDEILKSHFKIHDDGWNFHSFSYDWDDLSNIKNLFDIFEPSFQTTNSFDALNRMKTILYPVDVENSRKKLQIYHNSGGLFEKLIFNGDTLIEKIGYNSKGERSIILYGNKIATRYFYDQDTFKLKKQISNNFQLDDNIIKFSKVIQNLHFQYDLVGNVLQLIDQNSKNPLLSSREGIMLYERCFEYDPFYRLISATGREFDEQREHFDLWNCFPEGNNENKTREYQEKYSYDETDNLISISHETKTNSFTKAINHKKNNNQVDNVELSKKIYDYHYDDNGNVIREGNDRCYQWDHGNRLCSFFIKKQNSEPSVASIYLYNSSGKRIKKFVWKNGGNYCESTVYTESLLEFHRIIHGKTIEENNTINFVDGMKNIAQFRIGKPFKNDTTPAKKFYLVDHLNNCSMTCDEKGDVFNWEEFSPFGETLFGGFQRKRYRFIGKECDDESNLYYMTKRYYAPRCCKFFSIDPLGSINGPNLYQYSLNNPINFTDPKGTTAQNPYFIYDRVGAVEGGFANHLTSTGGSSPNSTPKSNSVSQQPSGENSGQSTPPTTSPNHQANPSKSGSNPEGTTGDPTTQNERVENTKSGYKDPEGQNKTYSENYMKQMTEGLSKGKAHGPIAMMAPGENTANMMSSIVNSTGIQDMGPTPNGMADQMMYGAEGLGRAGMAVMGMMGAFMMGMIHWAMLSDSVEDFIPDDSETRDYSDQMCSPDGMMTDPDGMGDGMFAFGAMSEAEETLYILGEDSTLDGGQGEGGGSGSGGGGDTKEMPADNDDGGDEMDE